MQSQKGQLHKCKKQNSLALGCCKSLCILSTLSYLKLVVLFHHLNPIQEYLFRQFDGVTLWFLNDRCNDPAHNIPLWHLFDKMLALFLFQSHIQSTSDRIQYNDLQSLLCATLQVTLLSLLWFWSLCFYVSVLLLLSCVWVTWLGFWCLA